MADQEYTQPDEFVSIFDDEGNLTPRGQFITVLALRCVMDRVRENKANRLEQSLVGMLVVQNATDGMLIEVNGAALPPHYEELSSFLAANQPLYITRGSNGNPFLR